jgi:hypothetical protein
MYVQTLLSSLDILMLYGHGAWRMEEWVVGTLHVLLSLPNNCNLECLLETIATYLFVQSNSHAMIALLFASAVPLQ